MSVIVKSFGDKTPQQIEGIGTVATITWQKLEQYLGTIIAKKETERIEGIVVDETGITVKITTK